jgi:aminopeptidase
MDMLSRYAKVTVKIGLNVQPGQQVIIQAPVIAMPLVRLVTDEAYKAGASLVIPILNDEYMQLSRFKNTQDEKYYDVGANWLEDGIAKAFGDNAARLVILGNNPSYLKDIDPNIVARVSRSASKAKSNLYGLITGGASNWSIVAYATPEWAKQVFPELPVDQAVDKLWNAIYQVSRKTPSFMSEI